MTDTKVKYMKLELIYTSHLHIQTVLEHCMLAVDLTFLSNIHTMLHINTMNETAVILSAFENH